MMSLFIANGYTRLSGFTYMKVIVSRLEITEASNRCFERDGENIIYQYYYRILVSVCSPLRHMDFSAASNARGAFSISEVIID